MSINDKKGKLRPLSEGLATEETLQDIQGNYTTRIYNAGGYVYVCEATIGAATSNAVWRISRIDSNGNELFADSNSNFDNVADNYATLSYG